MRKLVIAVIVLSLLGYGPLKSYFHNGNIIKNTLKELPLEDQKIAENVLTIVSGKISSFQKWTEKSFNK